MHQKPRILSVEDDRIAQKILAVLFSHFECIFDIASSAAETLAFLEENDYDLILMDIGLPDMNGIDLSEMIQGQYSKIPIVVVSAYSEGHYKTRLDALGLEHVSKPLTKNKCEALFDKYLPSFGKFSSK